MRVTRSWDTAWLRPVLAAVGAVVLLGMVWWHPAWSVLLATIAALAGARLRAAAVWVGAGLVVVTGVVVVLAATSPTQSTT